jgi:hypothetical protein
MSYDVIKSILNLPFAGGALDEDTKAVAGGGSFNKRISIKGGVFRKMSGGKEVAKVEERSMNVIFVKMAHNPARTFYTQGYKEGVNVAPTCWSSDSKTPDEECKTPQASACDKCQFSVKGSGVTGQGTACRLSWRTAVVLPNDPSGDIMQLVLPATSVFGKEENGKYPFRAYVQYLANNNVSAGRVITKMQFDTNSPVPRLLFSAAAPTPVEDLETIKNQGQSASAVSAVKLTVFQQDEGDNGMFPPAATPPEEAAEAPEATLRDSKKAEPVETADVSDVLKKWSKKK